jgi:uncharacterized coiled-coil protein SlyX
VRARRHHRAPRSDDARAAQRCPRSNAYLSFLARSNAYLSTSPPRSEKFIYRPFELHERIVEHDAQIADLEAAVASRDQQIDELRSELSDIVSRLEAVESG